MLGAADKMTFWQKLFSFDGRLGRQDFWMATLAIWAVNIVMLVVLLTAGWGTIIALAAQADTIDKEDGAAALRVMAPLIPLFGVWILLQLALIWPQLAVCAKRLHDRGQSAQWLLMYVCAYAVNFIPILGLFLSIPIGFGLRIWWLVNLGCLEGTPGPNRYGDSPDPRFEAEQAFA